MLFGLLLFGTIVGAVVWFVAAYNNLLAAVHRSSQAWGNVDALLRQRHEEISSLVEICQRHLKYEQATFDRVIDARNTVFGARQIEDTAALGAAESELRAALAVLYERAAAAELTADQRFVVLRERLAALDVGIGERCALFNEAVRQNNAAIGRFPGSVVARLGGFRSRAPFEIDRHG